MCALLVAVSLLLSCVAAVCEPAWQPEEFPLGYWCGPPAQFNTLAAWQQVRDCNFTFGGMGGDYGLEGNRKMLGYCQQVGIKALLNDNRLTWQMTDADNWRATVGQVVRDYAACPALLGYFLQDEPNYQVFAPLGEISRELQSRDPRHLPYINLFPTYASVQQLGTPTYTDYLDKFLSIVKPSVLSYDHYCLQLGGRDADQYFENLGYIRQWAQRYGAQPWNIIQAMTWAPEAMRQPNDQEMRWQVYTSLAYGMKGIMYFIYWSYNDHPAEVGIVDHLGKPAKLFPIVKQLNGEMKALGKTLLGLTSVGVFHTGDIPPGATRLGHDALVSLPQDKSLVVGFFKDAGGVDYVMIANRSHTQAVDFTVGVAPCVTGVEQISALSGLPVTVPVIRGSLTLGLAPGDGKLLRLTTHFVYPEPPRPRAQIDFEFTREDDMLGWGEANSLENPVVRDGALTLTFTGADPYIIRRHMRLFPDQYKAVKVRMKLPPCEKEAQFFWTTADSPNLADDKYLNFPVIPDGEWHEYTIPVGSHAMWKGKAVRTIRLDPTTGGAAVGSKVSIAWIRGE